MINLEDYIFKYGRYLYRVTCKTCGKDRGYQRKNQENKNCRSCDSTMKSLGKKHSLESRIKRSAWNQGVNVNDFKDFIYNEDERDRIHFSKINKKIFERDDFTCCICEKRGGKLNAHHLESFNSNVDLRFDETNIVTMCEMCHLDFHVKYGRGNNTKLQFIEYKEFYDSK